MALSSRRRRSATGSMSLGEHLRELRRRLFISAAAIAGGTVAGFFVAPLIIDQLRVPIELIAEKQNAQIVYGSVTAAFDLRIQIALTFAVVVTSPVWLFQLFAFLVPGLSGRERRYTFGFFFSAAPLFVGGAASGWFVFPHMVELLTSFSSTAEATLLDARVYYDFVIKLVLSVGIAFVLPIFLVLLNFTGALSARTIIKGWRVAVLLIAVFCAIATPAADVLSMFLLAVPMVLLYLCAALVAHLHDRRAHRRLMHQPEVSVSLVHLPTSP